ncbi:MAG: hypothetical protein R3275_12460 [Saprospiraceae bacterium]|nr:hypothetical protein [Saprospiraceae bacterium]
MAKSRSLETFYLIKSMTKAEKRHFKLQFDQKNGLDKPLFIRLFDALDSMKNYKEMTLRNRLSDLSNRQIINLNRHLKTAILKSLRQVHINRRTDIYISEHIDYARILYSKGHYLQSLRILEKLLPISIKAEESVLQLEIMEFEKYIEARHITRSRGVKDKMERLIERSARMAGELKTTVELSNLSLDIHGYYIQRGFINDESDLIEIREHFTKELSKIDTAQLKFNDEVYLAQAYLWYNYITLNVPGVYRYALKWKGLFDNHKQMKLKDSSTYMRGMHYLLLSCFYSQQREKHGQFLNEFSRFLKKNEDNLPVTSQMLSFFYYKNAVINSHLLKGDYKGAIKHESSILNGIEHYENLIDVHRSLILYYKLAWLHFGVESYDRALELLNLIIHRKTKYLRRELQSYALLLHLVIHLQMGHYALSRHLLRSVRRGFQRSSLVNPTIDQILTILQNWIQEPSKRTMLASRLHHSLSSLDKNSFDWRSFTYFNFIDWSAALANSTTIEEATKKRIQRTASKAV